ncbi:hypothetical protein VTH06DRAFT_767 [Thermothelomyces fergusii]
MAESTAAAAANAPKAAAGPNGTTAAATTTPTATTTTAVDTAASSSSAGIPFYESQRKQLRELISRRRALEKKLAAIEEHIAVKEANYLESTPAGNIIIGFDNYVKGGSAAAAQRRKAGLIDQNKVFSRSSVSYNPAAAAAAAAAASDAQTPASTPAPTPMSSSFGNGNGPSGAPTPTSAAAAGGRANASKKGKRNTPAAAPGAEDSETDGREAKKARTSLGARK